MGWIIGKGIGVPFRLGGSGLGSSYWATHYISALSVLTTSDTTQTVTATIVGTGFDTCYFERSSDGVNWTAAGDSATGVYLATGLTANALYGWRARLGKGSNYGSYSSIAFDYTYPVDPDGNVYPMIKVGSQGWSVSNLKTTKYADGSAITNVTLNAAWAALTSEAYCWYDNDAATYKAIYGALYNWWAATHASGLNLIGTLAPNRKDWELLERFVGGDTLGGGKLKEVGLTHWKTPNTGATDEFGFGAVPGGQRVGATGSFANLTDYAIYWTSSPQYSASDAYLRLLDYNSAIFPEYNNPKKTGYSVKSIRLSAFTMTDHSETALNAMRTTLINLIWATYPTDGVDHITTGVAEVMASSASNLSSIDSLTLHITGIADRTCYVWHPTSPNGKMVLFHLGHSSPATGTDIWEDAGQADCIRALIEANYTVCGMYMPPSNAGVEGALHSYPTVASPYETVDDLHFFLDSAIRVMNEFDSTYDEFYMVGLSGGGWTTTLVAALDERIIKSAPVAGTLPLCATEHSGQLRDWEQHLSDLYNSVEYGDLYAMGCTSGRKQTQYLNENEGDADEGFNLIQYSHAPYEAEMKMITDNWALDWDTVTTNHEITTATTGKIVAFFNS